MSAALPLVYLVRHGETAGSLSGQGIRLWHDARR